LVVDDDKAFVARAQTLLENAGYSTLTAATGDAALRVGREQAPLVVLLEVELPDLNGYEVCRALRDELGQAVAIAFVSRSRTETFDISSGLLAGADDYLVKPCDPSELLARVGALLRRVAADKQGATATADPSNLTRRELEILQLLSDGFDQKDIAQRLWISRKTVGVHIEHILKKLHVHSRAQAVAAAYRERLVGSAEVGKPPTEADQAD
jgi:DNA-binding NarL/FixJ family response regulator